MSNDEANDVTKALAAFGAPAIRYHSFGQTQIRPSSVVLPRREAAPLSAGQAARPHALFDPPQLQPQDEPDAAPEMRPEVPSDIVDHGLGGASRSAAPSPLAEWAAPVAASLPSEETLAAKPYEIQPVLSAFAPLALNPVALSFAAPAFATQPPWPLAPSALVPPSDGAGLPPAATVMSEGATGGASAPKRVPVGDRLGTVESAAAGRGTGGRNLAALFEMLANAPRGGARTSQALPQMFKRR